ncbi:MAG: hypothetical protein WA160_03045 [Pseudobdellovibrio sp.]
MHTNELIFFLNKKKKCKKGNGILQVLAAMSFLFIIIYGIISMLAFSSKQQKQQNMIANLRELQVKVKNLLSDSDSWRNTINDATNASMICLTDKVTYPTGCPTGVANRLVRINDSNSGVFVDNLPLWTSAAFTSGGFTEGGTVCATTNSFNGTAGSGLDSCPFTYKMIWEVLAAGLDQGIRVSGRLIFNPSDTFAGRTALQLGKMTNTPLSDVLTLASDDSTKKAVNIAGSVSDATTQVYDANIGKYDIRVWRTTSTKAQSFRIFANTPAGTGNCPDTTFSTVAARKQLSEAYDPFDLVSISGGFNQNITIKRIGTYECDVSVSGNSVKSFQAQLWNTDGAGSVLGSGSSFASVGAQSTLEFSTVFTTTTANNILNIEQICEVDSGAQALGMLSPSAAAATVASLNCRLVEPQ